MKDIKEFSNLELMKEIGERAKKGKLGFSDLDFETVSEIKHVYKMEVEEQRKVYLMAYYYLSVLLEKSTVNIDFKRELLGDNGDYKDIAWYCETISKKIRESRAEQELKDAYNRGFEAGVKGVAKSLKNDENATSANHPKYTQA